MMTLDPASSPLIHCILNRSAEYVFMTVMILINTVRGLPGNWALPFRQAQHSVTEGSMSILPPSSFGMLPAYR